MNLEGARNHRNKKKKQKQKLHTGKDRQFKMESVIKAYLTFFQAFITDNLSHPIQVFFQRSVRSWEESWSGVNLCSLIDDQYSQWKLLPLKRFFFHHCVFPPLSILIAGVLKTFQIDSWISQIRLVKQQT